MRSGTISVLPLTGILYLSWLRDMAVAAGVQWVTPTADDTFGSGDTIVGQWSADTPVVSPSFKLCIMHGDGSANKSDTDSDDGTGAQGGSCGTAVWPTIKSDSDGSYMIQMQVHTVCLPHVR